MSDEWAFLISLGITLASSSAVVFYMRRPLHALLTQICGDDHWANFWSAYANLMLVLIPIAVLLLALERPAPAAPIVIVLGQLKWSLTGLVIAVFAVSASLLLFLPVRPQLSVSTPQMRDLERLLEKVEELRAREIVSRAASSRN